MGKANRSYRVWAERGHDIYARRWYTIQGKHYNVLFLTNLEGIVEIWSDSPGGFTAAHVCSFFEHARPLLEQSHVRYIQLDGALTHFADLIHKINSIQNCDGLPILTLRQP